MKSKDIIVLNKIIDYCNQAEDACKMFEDSFDRFVTESVFRNACCMCILQIGELCKVVSDDIRNEESQIPWRQWCGVRDVFAHQYSNLDYESAWETVQEDLPELKKEISSILEAVDL